MRWQPAPIAGGAYSDDAMPWTCQDTVNYLPVPAERPGTRSPSILRSAPGFSTFCASMQEAPVRGLHNVEGLLLAVTGDTLYRIGTDGAATEIGTIPGVQRVSMAHNKITDGFEVMVANGQSGYVYNTVTGTLAQVTDDGFPGMKVCDFVDGYIAGVEPFGRYWFHSNLNAATDYNTLDRYSAESEPDKIVSLIVSHREVMVLGERTTQFYRNTGAATGTFQNYNGTEQEVGCASPHAVARLDNSVYWLANDGTVRRLEGHAAVRISTGPLEQAISRCNASNAFAFTFEDRGHKVFYLTLPDGQTWGYDVWSREWHRRRSKDLDRWRLSALVRWNGAWIGGDFSNGRLYQLDWAVQSEAGEEMEKRRITPVLHDNQNRVTVNAVEIVVDTGMGQIGDNPVLPDLTIAGDVPDGDVGDAVSGAYTATGGVLPRGAFSIISGAFPPGLTLNSNGTYSGSYTEGGSFVWTVQVEGADGNTATLVDNADVYVSDWWLTGAESGAPRDSLWVSRSVADWSAAYETTRSQWVDPSGGVAGGGYLQVSDTSALIVSSDGSAEYTSDLDASDGVVTSISTVFGTSTSVRARAISGLVFAFNSSGAATYYVSSDAGATWSPRTAPGGLKAGDIARMDSGVWVMFVQSGSTQRFYYSEDEGEPSNWIQASGAADTNAGSNAIHCNGTSALTIGTDGRVFRTVDGMTWTKTAAGVAGSTTHGSCGAAYGDTYVLGDTNVATLLRSTDAGVTWSEIAFRTTRRIDAHGSMWVACCPGATGGIFYSSDDGATWPAASLPAGVDSTFYSSLFVAPIRYLP